MFGFRLFCSLIIYFSSSFSLDWLAVAILYLSFVRSVTLVSSVVTHLVYIYNRPLRYEILHRINLTNGRRGTRVSRRGRESQPFILLGTTLVIRWGFPRRFSPVQNEEEQWIVLILFSRIRRDSLLFVTFVFVSSFCSQFESYFCVLNFQLSGLERVEIERRQGGFWSKRSKS